MNDPKTIEEEPSIAEMRRDFYQKTNPSFVERNALAILYIPDLEEHIVRIVRVLYSGRNIREQLKQI